MDRLINVMSGTLGEVRLPEDDTLPSQPGTEPG